MKIGTKERSTILAIQDISTRYPYAAALLVYVIVERILKEYIIKHRNTKSLLYYSFCKPSKSSASKISLENCHKYDESKFTAKFIKKITLGDAQKIVLANKGNNYATARNNLVHSNLYLHKERKYSEAERGANDRKRYKNSREHLVFVMNEFSDLKLRLRDDKIKIVD